MLPPQFVWIPTPVALRCRYSPHASAWACAGVTPVRDPFRPFFINPDAVPGAAPGAGVATGAPAPAGLHLRAIIAGEFAVIGEETVAVGDEVTDSEGHHFVVEEIQERRVVLREGGRRAELGYASTGRASDKSTKGTRK